MLVMGEGIRFGGRNVKVLVMCERIRFGVECQGVGYG